MTFLIKLMFRRLDKLDRPIFEGAYILRVGVGGFLFGMLIGLHIWGAYSGGGLKTEGVLTKFYGI